MQQSYFYIILFNIIHLFTIIKKGQNFGFCPFFMPK